jgi:phage baseplate assembly protein W
MGSLVVKLDNKTVKKLDNRHHYSDIDMLTFRNPNQMDVPVAYDVEAVKMSIRNILMWRVGESVLRPEFGHNLHQSMYGQLNKFNQDKVCEEVKRAIEENEPRANVRVVNATREEDMENNALKIKVAYTVVGDKTEDAEFVEETTILGK